MRIVLGTSVLVSAIFFGGPPGQILSAWADGRVVLTMSLEIVDEYLRVARLIGDRHPGIEIEPVLALLVQNSVVVPSPPLPKPVCDDKDDDKFLACALAGGARIVVSGDKKLRDTSGYRGITVLTPRQFLESYL